MRRVAIIFGASHYLDAQINSLPGAEPDCRRIGELLSVHGRFEVHWVMGAECNSHSMLADVEKLARELEDGDILVLFAAAHAAVIHDKQFLICPQANLGHLEHHQTGDAVSVPLIESLTNVPGVQRVFIFDTCRNHLRARDRKVAILEADVTFNARNLLSRRRLASSGNAEDASLTIMSACEHGCAAQEIPGRERGLFSLAFEKAFLDRIESGQPVALDDGFAEDVGKSMRSIARRHGLNGRQKPSRSQVGPIPVLVPLELLVEAPIDSEPQGRDGETDELKSLYSPKESASVPDELAAGDAIAKPTVAGGRLWPKALAFACLILVAGGGLYLNDMRQRRERVYAEISSQIQGLEPLSDSGSVSAIRLAVDGARTVIGRPRYSNLTNSLSARLNDIRSERSRRVGLATLEVQAMTNVVPEVDFDRRLAPYSQLRANPWSGDTGPLESEIQRKRQEFRWIAELESSTKRNQVQALHQQIQSLIEGRALEPTILEIVRRKMRDVGEEERRRRRNEALTSVNGVRELDSESRLNEVEASLKPFIEELPSEDVDVVKRAITDKRQGIQRRTIQALRAEAAESSSWSQIEPVREQLIKLEPRLAGTPLAELLAKTLEFVRSRQATLSNFILPAYPAGASREYSWTNSLGMKFVGVPGTKVLFSVWETRVRDIPKASAPFQQGPLHPVVNVSWNDAQSFCRGLTLAERASGRIGKYQYYRLPTDLEWSLAVGLPEDERRAAPEERHSQRIQKFPNYFPWGREAFRRSQDGNYGGSDVDNWLFTSPVGSYQPNEFGIYDLGGNVWEWTADFMNGVNGNCALRGGGFNTGDYDAMRSSFRLDLPPTMSRPDCGFRVVLAWE